MNESKRNGNGLGEQWASPQASEYVIIIPFTHVTVLYFQYSLLMILLKSTLLSPFKMNHFLHVSGNSLFNLLILMLLWLNL